MTLGNVEQGTALTEEEDGARKRARRGEASAENARRARDVQHAARRARQEALGVTYQIITANVDSGTLELLDRLAFEGGFPTSRSEMIRQAIQHYLLDIVPRVRAVFASVFEGREGT